LFEKPIKVSLELEDRFEKFAQRTRDFCLKVRKDLINSDYIRQLLRSSASVPANYIEASDDLGRSDERMKIRIARRESKEAAIFLKLIVTYNDNNLAMEQAKLLEEASEIRKILSAILKKLG
jgi:four helix bundle protein